LSNILSNIRGGGSSRVILVREKVRVPKIYGMTEFRSPTPPFDGPNGISVDAFTHIGKIDFLLRCIIGELN
jgi:hypothetical protein